MNKEELETNKAALTLLASETNEKLVDYKAQVSVIEQQLEDLGKPEVTPEFLDKIGETITKAVEELEFDAEDIELNLEMDYDNKVNIDTAELKNPHDYKVLIQTKLLYCHNQAQTLYYSYLDH